MRNSAITKVFVLLLVVQTIFLMSRNSSHALDVSRSVLDNGLTLLIVERHNLPIVKVSLGLNAGSLHDPAEKSGLANIVAALLAEGTKNRTAQEISEEIDFVGGSIGAGGGNDYVTANLSILKKDIELGFDLLSDIILNPVFPEEELLKKRERIKGSLKAQEEDPGFVASKHFKKEVFGIHPYGILLSGTSETLDRITQEDLLDFHTGYYVPNNAVMTVVGDVTIEEVTGLVKKYFARWRSGNNVPPILPLLKRAKEKKRIIIDKNLAQANIILGHVGVSRDNPDYYALSVMNYILGGGGFASRLMQNVREEKGLVYDIRSFFGANKYGGQFQVSLKTKNESANTAIEEILKEINRIRDYPVSDEELSDAKSFLTGSFPMRIETSARIAGFLVAVEYYGLGREYIDDYPGYINDVTGEDVLRVARQYLDPENYILVVVANLDKAGLREDFQ